MNLKKISLLVVGGLVAVLLCTAANQITYDAGGIHIGGATADKIGFYNATAVVQPTASAQAALTDSTTGASSGTTLAAGVGVNTVTIPLTSLATGLSTSAIDLLTAYTPGYKFKLLALDFVTTVAGTGTSASQAFNLAIGSTATTGGVCTVTLASTDTIGKVTAGTSITAANTGTASDTLSIKMAAGGTVFTAGAGYFVIKIQNMDTADAHAAEVRLLNATRTALVNLGLMKGS